MPEITDTLYVTTPAEWRAWLEKNHDKAKEIWLIYPNKASGKPRIVYNDAVEEALCFGWIDSTIKKFGADASTQRFSPRKSHAYFSQPNIERLRHLAEEGKLLPSVYKHVKPIIEQEFVFPKDIMKAIEKNPRAHEYFQASSPTYQRIRVAYVDSARKRPEEFEKRLRSLIVASEQNKQLGFGGIEKYY